jgi:hypothetical protein
MKLRFLPDSLLATLKRRIPENLKKYGESDKAWLEAYVAAADLPGLAESGIEIADWPLLINASGEHISDSDAAEKLHGCLRQLTPVQASDERLWAYLCHVEPFYGYVRARWLKGDREQKESVINRRFFFENRGLGGTAKNALARLWWCGYLTCEEGAKDPYMYTRMLMQYADTPVGLLERCLGKNPDIVRQVSRYVFENAMRWPDRSHTIQKVIRSINSAGGAMVLDALSDSALYGLCARCVD